MPDMSSGVPAGVPPEDYSDYITTQRQQMLANALMANSMAPIEAPTTQAVKGIYVQPRIGAGQAVSKIAEALMGKSAANKALQSQIALQTTLNKAYAPGGQVVAQGTPLQQAPAGTGSNAEGDDQGVQPAIARAPGASLAQTVQQTQPTRTPVNPRNPQGLPAEAVRQLAMTNPAEYAKYIQGPEWAQQARAAGLDPATAARALLEKATTIQSRPGETVTNGVTGQTSMAGDPSKGVTYTRNADGSYSAVPIANDAEIQAARAGLTTAEQQANTPHELQMGGGRTSVGYAPTPPALRGQAPPQAALAGPGPAPPSAAPAGGPAPGAAAPGAAPPTLPGQARPPGPPAVPPQVSPRPPAPAPAQGLWSTMPKAQVPPVTPNMGSDAGTLQDLKNASDKKAALATEYGQQSALADQQLDLNRRALTALPNAEVGPMSEWLTTNRQRLIEAYPALAKVIPSSGTVTPTLELNKELLNSALQGARTIYGNRMTQNEVKLQTEEMSPSSHMTADAIRSLVAQGNVQAQYTKQRAQDFGTYTAKGGDPMQFETWYAQQRPLSEYAAMQSLSPQQRQVALQRFSQNPGSRDDFKRTLGFDPVNWQ